MEQDMTIADILSDEIPPLRRAETSRGKISYREAGTGPALVLLHGLNGNSKSWPFQYGGLASDFRVIAWDAPGYGESDLVAPVVAAYAAQLAHLLDHLSLDRVSVLGHSMGGVVAGAFCGLYPDRAGRLVLSCTHWGNAVPPDAPLASKYAKRLADLNELSPADYGRARAIRMLPKSADEAVVARVASIAMDTRADGLLAAGQMVEKADNRPLLSTLTLPVLIIAGEQDTVVAPERSFAMRKHIAAASCVTLPGVGHAPYLEAPAAFNETVRRFLQAR
jgi:pimeloyl-ACP methyl ester carboxylesterase